MQQLLRSPNRSPQELAHNACDADARQGTVINIIIITNGDKGCGAAFCQNYTSPDIAAVRHAEALAAAAALGVPSSNVGARPPHIPQLM